MVVSQHSSFQYALNWAFVKRLLRLHTVFLFPKLLSSSSLLLVSLLGLKMCEEVVGYRVGLLSSAFDLVLVGRDFEAYLRTLVFSLLLVSFMSVLKALRQFVQKLLTIAWRRQVTSGLHDLYFEHNRFYTLNCLNNATVDNGDQRMTADVDLLTTTYGQIVAEIVVAPFTIAYYFYDSYTRAGWQGPSLAVAIFLVFTIVNRLIMAPIVRAVAKKERAEGDFRYTHVDTRSNSESVAFVDGGRVYQSRLTDQFDHLLAIQKRLYKLQLVLDTSVIFFGYIMVNASFVLIAVPIFDGSYDHLDDAQLASYISANAFVTISLVYQLTKLVQQSEQVSSIAGVTLRIMELLELLLSTPKLDSRPSNASNTMATVDSTSPVYMELLNLTITTPNTNHLLVQALSLELTLASNLLICGPSSSGKSSLLRVIKGLWKPDKGLVVHKMNHLKLCFVSQRIHLCEGLTLREQLAFPDVKEKPLTHQEDSHDLQLIEMLKHFELMSVFSMYGLDEPLRSWNRVLSPGEQQRLSLLRLLLARPSVAFLDEVTSAISVEMEHRLMTTLVEANITLVSVGHRQSLEKFHHRVLNIQGDGSWSLREASISS